MANVKVGLVQMSCVKDAQANMDKAIREIRKAAKDGAQIICLQEIFKTLYFCDVEDYDNFAYESDIRVNDMFEQMELKFKYLRLTRR